MPSSAAHRWPICQATGKRRLGERKDVALAVGAAESSRQQAELRGGRSTWTVVRGYRCDHCHGWHLTSRRRSWPATVAAAVLLLATLAGCGLDPGGAPAAASTGLCPSEIQELVDTEHQPATEIVAAIDGSGSFMGQPGAGGPAQERVRQQVDALVARAVDQGAALHIMVFDDTVATTRDAVVCATVAARYNNEAAKTAKVNYLKEQAAPAVWAAVQNVRPTGGRGTSVVGGWRAVSETTSLAAKRQAVMLSDGQARKEASVPVDLSGFATVGMYSIGIVAGKAQSTPQTVALADHWHKWLTAHRAKDPVATTRPFS